MRNFGKEFNIIDTGSFMVARVRVAGRHRKVHLHNMPKLTNGERGGVGDEELPVRGGTGDSRE